MNFLQSAVKITIPTFSEQTGEKTKIISDSDSMMTKNLYYSNACCANINIELKEIANN